MIGALPQRARRIRAVTVDDDLTIDLDDVPAGYYFPLRARHIPGDGGERPRTGAPRVRYVTREPSLGQAERLEIEDAVTVELVEPHQPLYNGRRIVGYQGEAVAVADLYPLTASLQEQGGSVVTASVPVAIYSPADTVTDHGDFDNLDGEAPVEYLAALRTRNRQLVVGSDTFRILSAQLDSGGRFVALRLRRA